MALLALGLDVLAQQRELRFAVIKPDVIALPALFVVAILALLAFLAVVLVVLLVTGVAIGRRLVAIGRRGMTLLTLGILVLEFQRVFSVLVMIEADVTTLPALFVMALLALLAQVAMMTLVVVSFLVAVITDILQLLLVELACVTLVALDLEVLETQWIFGVLVVIEINLLPVIFLMAGFALLAEITFVRFFVVLLVA